MFKEVIRTIFSLIRSPLLFLPALLAVFANLILLLLFQGPLTTLVSELLAGSLLDVEFSFNPVFLLTTFATEWAWLGLFILCTILLNSWIGWVFARFCRTQEEKNPAVLASTVHAVLRLPRLLIWSILLFIFSLFFLTLLLVFQSFSVIHPLLSMLFFILWILFVLFAVLVFAFTVPIMGLKDLSIREALQESRGFVQHRLFSVLVFMIFIGILLLILQFFGDFFSRSLENEWAQTAVLAVFLFLQIILAHLSLPFYFLEKDHS